MNDVTKKRVVGAVVLVALGIALPLLLARFLHGQAPADNESTRVYEVTPDGQTRPATNNAAGDVDDANTTRSGAGNGQQAGAAGDRNAPDAGPDGGGQKPPTPAVVSPSATPEAVEQSAQADGSLQTPPVQGGSRETASSSDAGNTAGSSSSQSSSNQGKQQSLRRTNGVSGWVVQVASFSDEDYARRLARKLSADQDVFYRAGTVGGKTWYRVAVGPFESKSKARAAAAKLQSSGRDTLVRRAR